MKRLIIGLLATAMLPSGLSAQRIQQKLGRSVVAVASTPDVLVTWRKLAQEPENCTYNLYMRQKGTQNYTKVNAEPIAKTNYQMSLSALPSGTELAVTMVTPDGKEGEMSEPFCYNTQEWRDTFFRFDFETDVLNPENYLTKFVWPMDLDGNGEFDALLVDRVNNGAGNPEPSADGQVYARSNKLQAYTLDGKCLWTVDMGPNVDLSSGQNDMALAYDINCDGRCEVIIKSSDGTRFWDSSANMWGRYANNSAEADTDGDGIVNYRTQTKRNPPFYVSVLDGRTGAEIDCSELDYSQITDGVDTYSRDNRSDYYDDNEGTEYAFLSAKFAICYFDGIHPSLAVQCYDRDKETGHHYYVLEWKYDWNGGGTPSNWHHAYTWPKNSGNPPAAEFHQFRVADVDGDGIDELMEGGYAVNSTKGMVMSPGIGHGDRFDVSDIDPDRPGLEVYAIQQSNLLGQLLYDAATGEHIKEWYLSTIGDVGRGRCIDVDSTHKGYEIFSTMPNLYDCKGNVISEGDVAYPVEAIWWDGDLQRELLASPGGSNHGTNINVHKYDGTRLIEFSKESGWAVHAGSAVRPTYMGDMTGDWREEVILAIQNEQRSTGLVGYSTNIPTDYSFYTLQEDPHYRLDCTTRGYYQMPCTGFYLGGDMPYPPLPPTMVTDLRWDNGAQWSTSGTGFTTFDMTSPASYADGKSVIFDMSGDNSQEIALSGTLQPSAVYVMAPKGHDYSFGGDGTLAGQMELWKSMQGTATFNNQLNYTGRTVISEGTLCVNGTVAGPVELRAKGTLAGTGTVNGDMAFEQALNYEGCRIMPGNATDKFGTLTFGKSLTLPGDVYLEFTAAEGKSSKIAVNGDMTIEAGNHITISIGSDVLEAGTYVLAECTGKLTTDIANIEVRGLKQGYDIAVEDNRLMLTVNAARAPQQGVVWTGNESNIWDYKADNFTVGDAPTTFVVDDGVMFTDASANRNIVIDENVVTSGVEFDFDEGTYTLSGNGGISGNGGLTKNGRGEVRIELTNSDYTGPTVLNEGILTVTNLADGGSKSALGAATADEGNLQLNGGTLKVEATNMATDRTVTLVGDTSTVYVATSNGTISLKGMVKGDGYLVKDGPGQLNFTYGGTNPFAGLIVKQGTVATGSWNSTFGNVGSPMVLAGGTVDLLDVNNSSTRPIFNYKVTVMEGTESTVMGTVRGAINGSFAGKGNLIIVSDGVRNDIGANFSAFEGRLTARGSNFRLMDNVLDMSKTRLVIDDGAIVSHYASNGSATRAVTTKIGSVESDASDCTLGNGADSYEVGFNNNDATYDGLLKAKSITKRGTGVWTLTSTGSTSSVTVAEGNLRMSNSRLSSTPSAFTTGTVTVNAGGTLSGTGGASTIVVNKGGVIAAATDTGYGTLKATGRVTLNAGSTIVVKIGATATGSATNDKYNFNDSLLHNGDTILVKVAQERVLAAGDEISVFIGKGAQKGNYVLVTECDDRTIEWDDTALLTEGVLKVASVTGIKNVGSDAQTVDVYSVDGVKLRVGVAREHALDGLAPNVYIVDGEKVIKD